MRGPTQPNPSPPSETLPRVSPHATPAAQKEPRRVKDGGGGRLAQAGAAEGRRRRYLPGAPLLSPRAPLLPARPRPSCVRPAALLTGLRGAG